MDSFYKNYAVIFVIAAQAETGSWFVHGYEEKNKTIWQRFALRFNALFRPTPERQNFAKQNFV